MAKKGAAELEKPSGARVIKLMAVADCSDLPLAVYTHSAAPHEVRLVEQTLNDYIEIFNRGAQTQSLSGWSIQYAAAMGTAWQVTPLTNVTLQLGQYYLIAQGAGANGVNAIPTSGASGTVAMSVTLAKVALVSSTTALLGACPTTPTIVDLVGYGASATCNEVGANAPDPFTTTADVRAGNGCTESDSNSTDFQQLRRTRETL